MEAESMAELEVAEHGKKVIQLARNKEHPIFHKVREIALEVLIIVFAVSISIWFHSVSEHRHEQQQVRSFLLGLKSDLARDVSQLDKIHKAYRGFDANYAYLSSLDAKAVAEGEKFDVAFAAADSNFYFIPENSRYEGFKSSGKLTNVEDEQLLNDILSLYQSILPQVRTSERGWGNRQEKLRDYIDVSLGAGDERELRYQAMVTPKAKRLLHRMQSSPQLYERYGEYAALSKQIIKRIDAMYPAF
jgi:hypothetical protein